MSKAKKTRVQRERELRGLTRYALAKAVGITQSHLQSIENGARPRVDLALRISKTLGLSVEELFGNAVAA